VAITVFGTGILPWRVDDARGLTQGGVLLGDMLCEEGGDGLAGVLVRGEGDVGFQVVMSAIARIRRGKGILRSI
jgi:hypothetical protein